MQRTYNLKGLHVFIAMPVRDQVDPRVVVALMNTMTALREKNISHNFAFKIGGTLCGGRNSIVADFLKSNANRLLFIDSDMLWTADDAIRLLAMSTVMDIVTVAYPARVDPPTFFIKVQDGKKIPRNEHGCAAIDGLGIGLTILHRKVLEELSAAAPVIKYNVSREAVPWVFKFELQDGQFKGEDIGFFEDAKKLGYQCWLDPSITPGHIGEKVYNAPVPLVADGEFYRVTDAVQQ